MVLFLLSSWGAFFSGTSCVLLLRPGDMNIYANGNSLGRYIRRYKIRLAQAALWADGFKITRRGCHDMLWISLR